MLFTVHMVRLLQYSPDKSKIIIESSETIFRNNKIRNYYESSIIFNINMLLLSVL